MCSIIVSFARVYRVGVWLGFVGSALLLAVVLCWVDCRFDSWMLLGLLCFLCVTPAMMWLCVGFLFGLCGFCVLHTRESSRFQSMSAAADAYAWHCQGRQKHTRIRKNYNQPNPVWILCVFWRCGLVWYLSGICVVSGLIKIFYIYILDITPNPNGHRPQRPCAPHRFLQLSSTFIVVVS